MNRIEAVDIGSARLMVEKEGVGDTPLVMLHGMASDRSTWDYIWPGLAARRHVIRYDLRGFGGSVALDDGGYRHSDDLRALLDRLGVERCDLIGVSLGGSVALNFALDHPDRVRRLILVSPAITGWDWSEDWRTLWRAVTGAARAGDMAGARKLWFEHPLFAPTRALPDAAAKLRANIENYSGAVWWPGDREEPSPLGTERLPMLAASTLLLTGTLDFPDFRGIADMIAERAPHVRRIDYEGAGHLVNLDRPDQVVSAVLDFLA